MPDEASVSSQSPSQSSGLHTGLPGVDVAHSASWSVPDALAHLGVSADRGLTSAEARARLVQYGPNEVAEQHAYPVLRFLAKFWGLSAWMLELIMLLSLFLRHTADFAIVTLLLVVNAAVSFAQERRAAGVVQALRQRLSIEARVRRDGQWARLAARELVPGDIVRLRAGDLVPADTKLITGALTIDQSALTGESADVSRAPSDVVPSGALVRRGEGDAVILLTGPRTYFGRTTELVQIARPKLHIEAVVAWVVRRLFVIVGSILVSVILLSLYRGESLVPMLPLLLVLLMSAVPVALPVMFTVSMAVGASELAKRGVLVTRLSAAEDAATMNVLCVDKTGTITLNQLAITAVSPESGCTEDNVLLAGALASQEADQDPIDLAFIAAAGARHLLDGTGAGTRVSFAPFDPALRRTEAVIELNGARVVVVKGAVRTIAEACGLAPTAIDGLEQRATDAAHAGARTLAVARGPEYGPLALLGLVSLRDPARPDARALIAAVRALGVRVVMLTGDARPVAQAVATEIGLGEIRSFAGLRETATSPKSGPSAARTDETAIGELAADVGGFAEVYPEDKFAIVQGLQRAGHVVGMTGDGINDAPALRQAEVGIAVVGATDVAKGAASVVLTEAGLTNIVPLVEQGRKIYQRILTWTINKISRTILKASFVALAYVLTGKLVISAFAMLLLTFMTDFAKITLATDDERASTHPESWQIRGYAFVGVVIGLLMVIETVFPLYVAWSRFGLGSSSAALDTFSFELLMYFAVFSIVSARERRWFWHSVPARALVLALITELVVGTALANLGLPGLASLPWRLTLAIFVYAALACLVVNDAVKVVSIRRWVPDAVARPAASLGTREQGMERWL